MFDEKTRQVLKQYVYVLLDLTDNKPFYVGKGIDNRVELFGMIISQLSKGSRFRHKHLQRGYTIEYHDSVNDLIRI